MAPQAAVRGPVSAVVAGDAPALGTVRVPGVRTGSFAPLKRRPLMNTLVRKRRWRRRGRRPHPDLEDAPLPGA